MGSREVLMSYLWDRMIAAWDAQDLDEAQSFNRYFDAIDNMSDIEYSQMYSIQDNKKVTVHDSI